MMKLTLLLMLLFLQPAPENEIILQLKDGNEVLPSVRINFADDSGAEVTSCMTNADGMCRLTNIPADEAIPYYRGNLIIGSYGTREVTWPGGLLQLAINVRDLGFDHPPHSRIEDSPPTIIYRAAPTAVSTIDTMAPLANDQIEAEAASHSWLTTIVGLLISLVFVGLIIVQGRKGRL